MSPRRIAAEASGALLLVLFLVAPPPDTGPDPRITLSIGFAMGVGVAMMRRRSQRKSFDVKHLFLGGWAGAVAASVLTHIALAVARGGSVGEGIGYGAGIGIGLGLWVSGAVALVTYGLTKTGSIIPSVPHAPASGAAPG